jgi:hypothetical protein
LGGWNPSKPTAGLPGTPPDPPISRFEEKNASPGSANHRLKAALPVVILVTFFGGKVALKHAQNAFKTLFRSACLCPIMRNA